MTLAPASCASIAALRPAEPPTIIGTPNEMVEPRSVFLINLMLWHYSKFEHSEKNKTHKALA
jgi:hypothetical protein